MIRTKQLGQSNLRVSEIGLGCMLMSLEERPSEAQSIETIHQALNLGITLLDTADSYCIDESEKHHNERLIQKSLKTYNGDTQSVVIMTKGGFTRPQGNWVKNGDPDYLYRTIQESFVALGEEKPIDLWFYHSPDPNYPIETSLSAAQKALAQGFIRHVGLSNVSLQQLQRARQIVEVIAVENQYNPWHRNPEQNGILHYCEQERVAFIPWSPLGGMGGKRRSTNLGQLQELHQFAIDREISVYGLILAWLRAKSPVIIPIPGARRTASIIDSVQSLEVRLTAEEVKQIDRLLPASSNQLAWIKRLLKRVG